MCRVLKVSESGYYHSLSHSCKPKPWQLLLVKIKQVYAKHPDNDNYGVNRVRLALEQDGSTVSKSTVRRAMKKGGLLKASPRRSGNLTESDADAQKADNLIARNFTADAPNRKWLTDITQIPCRDGKLYIAPVLDCYNGEIVGLAMDDNMKKELCIKAFESACRSQSAASMILHSDRGSQFTSAAFRTALARYDAIQSMSGTGRCYDNARMESFFATLKKEKLYKIETEQMLMAAEPDGGDERIPCPAADASCGIAAAGGRSRHGKSDTGV